MQLPSSFLPHHTVYSPLVEGGRLSVGLESDESNSVAFPPVTESSAISAVDSYPVKSTDESPWFMDASQTDSPEQEGMGSDEPDGRIDEQGLAGDQALSEEELAVIRELAARDREVRNHEAAHAAVGGILAGAPTYSYDLGPDGRKYAVAGEVSISLREVPGDPQATIASAEKVKRAALAPADPSAQDRRVAAAATRAAQQARSELLEQQSADEAQQSRENQHSQDQTAVLADESYHSPSHIDSYLSELAELESPAAIDRRA